jgi:hypothetical protein
MFMNTVLNGWIMVRTGAMYTIVILPFVFLIYRLAYADRVARALVSLTVIVPLYVIYFYARIFFAPAPDNPESLASKAAMGLLAPSEMLPLLIPAIAYLIGVILIWTPSALSWFAAPTTRNFDEAGDV